MQNFLVHYGYAALILFAFIEACCIPIPSEVTFGFAGVLAYQGHLSLPLVIVVGTLAELAGSLVAFTVGRVAERPVIERFGRYLLVTKADIDRAERFLTGRGAWAIPVGRALPLVRAFTSLVAGFAGVRPLRFGILSLVGTLAYATAISSIGYAVGSAWTKVEHDLSLAGYAIAVLVVIAIVAFVVYRVRELRHESAHDQYDGYDQPSARDGYDDQPSARRPARDGYDDQPAPRRPTRNGAHRR
jgi:membrane protein DedA with SNARE-associated domain